jgi:MFS family permease
LWLPAIGALLSLPFQAAFLLFPESVFWQIGSFTFPVAIIFMLIGGCFAAFWLGPVYAAIQNLAPNHLRTQASALLLLVFNLIGMGIGPLLVGVLSDALAPELGVFSIRYALVASLIAVLVGSLLFFLAAKPYVKALAFKKASVNT